MEDIRDLFTLHNDLPTSDHTLGVGCNGGLAFLILWGYSVTLSKMIGVLRQKSCFPVLTMDEFAALLIV